MSRDSQNTYSGDFVNDCPENAMDLLALLSLIYSRRYTITKPLQPYYRAGLVSPDFTSHATLLFTGLGSKGNVLSTQLPADRTNLKRCGAFERYPCYYADRPIARLSSPLFNLYSSPSRRSQATPRPVVAPRLKET